MRLNSIIPNFKVDTTQGPIDFYDWQGSSWVVLFSHPADFTPVCTTELGRIAVHQPHFVKRNTKLLAHSVDKLKDHVDWVNDIKSYCKDIPGAFPYPIIADPDRKLAVKLDMIDEQSKDDPETAQTVRSLYIISPDHRLRLSMQYPTSTGRNVDEILRVIDSLQLVDRRPEIATPANWVPGEKVMILPTVKEEDLPKLFPGGVDRISMPSGKVYVRTTTNY
ncbi:Peroxiredoxin-6 [Trachymyrmex zeteki]|uniref:1-Cys peroxiredoxin n=1 Tax=Mycetomoellerius zeteki TaxID=64791 RepID=A0A151WIF0_9HYME|nr:PREDICTED: peroxiredoxin-6-like [Trachymyrmex zeteki]XP_018314517.1 PREDICTED: peroxiredoxin-6-like [Trachymyrmex zeteki]KYQ47633.1 Peroxiredoxin-6 [Trachymyrmex zeteki]